MPTTLAEPEAAARHRDSVVSEMPSSRASELADCALGPSIRRTMFAFVVSLYVCMTASRTRPLGGYPPAGSAGGDNYPDAGGNRPSVSYGQPTHWRISANGGAAYDLKLDRDVLGRITRHVELLDGTTRTFDYAYDEAGRLSSVKIDSVKTPTHSASSTTSPSGAAIFVEAAAGPRRCVAEAT
jgi:hypothetical protein